MNYESLRATILFTQSEMWVLADSTIFTFVYLHSLSSKVEIPRPPISPTTMLSAMPSGVAEESGDASLTID